MPSHPQEISQAFSSRPELKKRVFDALDESPQHHYLFRDISAYVLELRQGGQHEALNGATGPAAKKRKLDGGDVTQNGTAKPTMDVWRDSDLVVAQTMPDVSFTVPQRKKLGLQFVQTSKGEGGLRGVNGKDGPAEFGVMWKDVEQVFCLPVPEKAKPQHNLVIIPRYGDGITPPPEGVAAPEPIVWAAPQTAEQPAAMVDMINQWLAPIGNRVILPDEEDFASAVAQSHRKGEKAYHVKAFRGSKDGFLFFLSTGILWAFKKPLLFFSFSSIASISYTSVLQRTFNLNITITASSADQKSQEFEFSMLDQADYAGIDAYIKRRGLHDASMAEQRRAKRYDVNGTASGGVKAENGTGEQHGHGEGGEEDVEEESELQKAERMLQDQEDDLEEDYDPGSGGESDGSGSDSDEEDEGYEGGEGQGADDGRNLVADELGSEAEEVEQEEEG